MGFLNKTGILNSSKGFFGLSITGGGSSPGGGFSPVTRVISSLTQERKNSHLSQDQSTSYSGGRGNWSINSRPPPNGKRYYTFYDFYGSNPFIDYGVYDYEYPSMSYGVGATGFEFNHEAGNFTLVNIVPTLTVNMWNSWAFGNSEIWYWDGDYASYPPYGEDVWADPGFQNDCIAAVVNLETDIQEGGDFSTIYPSSKIKVWVSWDKYILLGAREKVFDENGDFAGWAYTRRPRLESAYYPLGVIGAFRISPL